MNTSKIILFVLMIIVGGIVVYEIVTNERDDVLMRDALIDNEPDRNGYEQPLYLITKGVVITGDKNMTFVCDFALIKNPFLEYNEGKYINCTCIGGDNYIRMHGKGYIYQGEIKTYGDDN